MKVQSRRFLAVLMFPMMWTSLGCLVALNRLVPNAWMGALESDPLEDAIRVDDVGFLLMGLGGFSFMPLFWLLLPEGFPGGRGGGFLLEAKLLMRLRWAQLLSGLIMLLYVAMYSSTFLYTQVAIVSLTWNAFQWECATGIVGSVMYALLGFALMLFSFAPAPVEGRRPLAEKSKMAGVAWNLTLLGMFLFLFSSSWLYSTVNAKYSTYPIEPPPSAYYITPQLFLEKLAQGLQMALTASLARIVDQLWRTRALSRPLVAACVLSSVLSGVGAMIVFFSFIIGDAESFTIITSTAIAGSVAGLFCTALGSFLVGSVSMYLGWLCHEMQGYGQLVNASGDRSALVDGNNDQPPSYQNSVAGGAGGGGITFEYDK